MLKNCSGEGLRRKEVGPVCAGSERYLRVGLMAPPEVERLSGTDLCALNTFCTQWLHCGLPRSWGGL